MISKNVFNFLFNFYNVVFSWLPIYIQLLLGILMVCSVLLAVKRILI